MIVRRRASGPGRWETLRAHEAVLGAGALFAAVYLLQASDTRPADALEVFYLAPISLLAVRFGRRGGLLGAVVGIALIWVYNITSEVFDETVLGDVGWAVAFLLLGGALGSYVDHGKRLEQQVSRYFQESPDLLAVIDDDGLFVRVNPAWERTLGFSTETLCLHPFIDFVHPADRERTLAEHRASLAGARDTLGFRNRYMTADGGYRWLEWSGHAGEPHGELYAVARDVTAKHQDESQRANYAKVLEGAVVERTSELEDARAKTLHRLVLAAEYRDEDTFQHTERVADTAAEIATRLGLDSREVEVLREAAPLHDVGKIAIPDSILFKPGRLTPGEREVMKSHAPLGANLLAGSGSPVLQMGTSIARSHHERWDGAGYPEGLRGEEIPLVARIVAVADVFDALTHERPYKPAWSLDEALREIANGAGSQFDPGVVRAFLASRGRALEDLREASEHASSGGESTTFRRAPVPSS